MAFGVDDLVIAGIVALVAGAAANQYGQARQASKAQGQADQLLMQQRKQGEDINDEILKAADQYRDQARQDRTAEIAGELATRYEQPVLASQSGRSEGQAVEGNVSDDYKSAKARRDAQSLQDVRDLASLMGRVNSASRLRMNEGFDLAKAQQRIAQMNKFNNMDNTLGLMQVQATANGRNGWNNLGDGLQILGTALATYGAAGAAAGGAAAGSSAAAGGSSAGTGLTTAAAHNGVNSGLVAGAGSTLPTSTLGSGFMTGLRAGARYASPLLTNLSGGMQGYSGLSRRG